MPDNNIAFPTESDEKGFADAVSLFAKDDAAQPAAPQPTPQPTPQVAEPESEPAPEQAAAEEGTNIDAEEKAKTEPEKFEEEYVEFQGKQKERFNSVYGKMRSYERANQDLERRLQQYQQVQQQPQYQPQPVVPQPQFQPQQVSRPEPLLENFATADEWGRELVKWTKDQVLSEVRVETARERATREQQEVVQQQHNYINGRIAEAQKKVGLKQFNEAAKEILPYAPHYSTMYNELFSLERFPEVVVHLSKNVELADHISSLDQREQMVELRLLERKLALAAKQPPKLPTKVEAPGNGNDQKPELSVPKLRAAAKSSGQVKDWAKVFQADPTM